MLLRAIVWAFACAGLMRASGAMAQPTPTATRSVEVTAKGGQPAKAEKPKLYDVDADAKQQIAAAVTKAKKGNQRVLVQWGGNWCGWCILLDKCMKEDQAINKLVRYEYVVVHVDAGVPDGKNIGLATSYGADLKRHGFPYLTVLDAEGKVIVNQDTGSLEDGPKHDTVKVLAFLKKHAAEAVAAQGALDAAIRDAKSSGRMVFVHFGAPWCGWCHRLESWMARPEVAALLAKDFVDVKIDIDRMTGGQDVIKKYRGEKDVGIPWFVFVDADGKALVTSDGPEGNVGFPAAAEEIAHFKSMLARVKGKLTAAERARLVETLRSDSEPNSSATSTGD